MARKKKNGLDGIEVVEIDEKAQKRDSKRDSKRRRKKGEVTVEIDAADIPRTPVKAPISAAAVQASADTAVSAESAKADPGKDDLAQAVAAIFAGSDDTVDAGGAAPVTSLSSVFVDDTAAAPPASGDDAVEAVSAGEGNYFLESSSAWRGVDDSTPAPRGSSRTRTEDETLYINPEDRNALKLLETSGRRPQAPPLSVSRIPLRVIASTLCVLTILAAVGGGFLLYQMGVLADQVEQERAEGLIFLDNSSAWSNANNFVHTEVDIAVGGHELVLRRMAFDDRASVFYFEQELDFTALDIWIVDNFGNEPGFDAAFIDHDGRVLFPERSVRFDPLTLGTRNLTLGIRDRVSGEQAEILFEFTDFHGRTAETSFERMLSITDRDDRVVGTVQGATFASTGSSVYFVLEQDSYLRFDPELAGSSALLMERAREVTPLTERPMMYDLNGQRFSRANFRPISHLPGLVYFVLSRVFTEFPIDQTVGAAQLINNLSLDNVIVFDAGGYHVVLERILLHPDSSLRLVLHAYDPAAEIEGPTDRSNRREVLLDCQLIVTLATGEVIVLDATDGVSRDIGANVFFRPEDEQHAAAIISGQFTGMEIVAHDALIRADDIAVRLDMEQLSGFTTESFVYNLERHLTRAGADRERYSVSVISYQMLDGYYRAVVREVWRENGAYQVVTRELYGYVSRFLMELHEDNLIYHFQGLF